MGESSRESDVGASGTCPACGYDMRGCEGEVCPECGLSAPQYYRGLHGRYVKHSYWYALVAVVVAMIALAMDVLGGDPLLIAPMSFVIVGVALGLFFVFLRIGQESSPRPLRACLWIRAATMLLIPLITAQIGAALCYAFAQSKLNEMVVQMLALVTMWGPAVILSLALVQVMRDIGRLEPGAKRTPAVLAFLVPAMMVQSGVWFAALLILVPAMMDRFG